MVDSKYNLIDGDSMVDSDYSIRLISSWILMVKNGGFFLGFCGIQQLTDGVTECHHPENLPSGYD